MTIGRQRSKSIELPPHPVSGVLLAAVFGSLEVVVYVVDPGNHDLLYMNAECRRLFGDRVGSPCYRVLQNRDAPCPFCSNAQIFGANLGKTHVAEVPNAVNQCWYHCVDRAIPWQDGRNVKLRLASDISRMKNAQHELERDKALLENRVKKDAGRLRTAQKSLREASSAGERLEGLLRESRRQLSKCQAEVKAKQIALREVLVEVDREKKRLGEEVRYNVDVLLGRVEKLAVNGMSTVPLDLLRQELEDLVSSFGYNLAHLQSSLSPRQIEICEMIHHGHTSKEISTLLGICLETVQTHRRLIRRKLGISNEKINLHTFLDRIAANRCAPDGPGATL